MDATQKIKHFFEAYQDRFNSALQGHDDIDGTSDAFAECFINASPSGIYCGSNNAEFRKAIPKGNQFYRDIGALSMHIRRIETKQLNSVHYMAKVFWKSTYNKAGEHRRIDFDVVYLLQYRNEVFKIFAYITEDERKALQEHGLLPGTT